VPPLLPLPGVSAERASLQKRCAPPLAPFRTASRRQVVLICLEFRVPYFGFLMIDISKYSFLCGLHLFFHFASPNQLTCASSIDAAVTGAIKSADKQLAAYLKSTFFVSNGDKPHALKF
jgi:hypothetical protein